MVTSELFDREKADLQAEVLKLRRDLMISEALFGILVVFMKVFGLKLSDNRLPEGDHKDQLLKAIEKARKLQPLESVHTI